MLTEKLQNQELVLVEARNLDDYKRNLEARYGVPTNINENYSAKFDSKLNQIEKQFTKGLGEFIDPIILLYEMHYNWKYSCGDINETLKEFDIFWDPRGMKEQLTHFLGWNVNDAPTIRRFSKNAQLKKEKKEEDRKLLLEAKQKRKLELQEKKDLEKGQEKEARKIETKKSRILNSLKTLQKERDFDIKTYTLLGNMTDRISYVLGIHSGTFNSWVTSQRKNKPVQMLSDGIVSYVNEIIVSEKLQIENITYSKARVSRAGKRKPLTKNQKSKLIKNNQKKVLHNSVNIIYSHLMGDEQKISLDSEQKKQIKELKYGSHKAIYMLTQGDENKLGDIITSLQSAKKDFSSTAISQAINKIFKTLNIKECITGGQISKYLKKKETNTNNDSCEKKSNAGGNHLPKELEWLS